MANNAAMLLYEYLDEMEMLTDEEFGRLCRFLLRYSSTGDTHVNTFLEGNERFFYKRVMLAEDRFKAKYERVCEKRRKSAEKAAATRWHAKECDSMRTHTNACESMQPNAIDAYPEPEPEPDPVPVPVPEPGPEPEPEPEPVPEPDPVSLKRESNILRFAPPTVDEVSAYCVVRCNGIDPQAFVDYYQQQGWKLTSGNKMKDWRAAVRTWEARDRKKKREEPAKPAVDPIDMDLDDFWL